MAPLPGCAVAGRDGDGLAATGTAVVLELIDLFCEVLEIGDGADENLEFKLFFARWLWLLPGLGGVEFVVVVVVIVIWLVVRGTFVLGRDEFPQRG